MLPLPVVMEICRLLHEGDLSQREIAAKLRVGRGSVNSLANGTRPVVGRLESKRDKSRRVAALPVRCPDCGGLVFAPCALCKTRAWRRRKRLKLHDGDDASRPPHTPRRAA
jgi:hypothetical protein